MSIGGHCLHGHYRWFIRKVKSIQLRIISRDVVNVIRNAVDHVGVQACQFKNDEFLCGVRLWKQRRQKDKEFFRIPVFVKHEDERTLQLYSLSAAISIVRIMSTIRSILLAVFKGEIIFTPQSSFLQPDSAMA